MICKLCGNTVPVDAPRPAACPRCGPAGPVPARPARFAMASGGTAPAGSASGVPGSASGGPAPAGSAPAGSAPAGSAPDPSFRLDASRWTRGDLVTGVATVVLLVSLFLPWYGVSFLGISAQVDGLTGHGYLYIVLIGCVAIIGYLAAAAGFEELPVRLPLSHERRLLAGTSVNAALVLLAFLVKPGDSGWRFGAFAGIVAAVVAAGPLVGPAIRARTIRA